MKRKTTLPLIIAHRGASAVAPENTIASFDRAIEAGAQGIEFDVNLTRDNVPVVFHDYSLKRMANSSIKVAELNFKELSGVDVGDWFNKSNIDFADENFAGEGIPSLEMVMDNLRDFKGPVYVEIKSDGKNSKTISEATAEVLRDYSEHMKLIVKSFDFETIPCVKKICPEVETAALFVPNIIRILRKEKRLINITREIGAGRLSIHFSLASKKLMKKAAKAGIPVTVWTVDNPRLFKRSTALGVDSVITNDPKRLITARDLELNGYSILS